ncbi:hypothetical protein BDB01DRAFT_856183 [Pilobolus umbonatus]|nr:hypothetical protein BDB01DRAFT_856183 [Pilobolus umbonatus]
MKNMNICRIWHMWPQGFLIELQPFRDTDNFVDYQNPYRYEPGPLFPHVPVRTNKRRFKPQIPANKRARRKIAQ